MINEQEAIRILRNHQAWLVGDDNLGVTPVKELTAAIKTAILALERFCKTRSNVSATDVEILEALQTLSGYDLMCDVCPSIVADAAKRLEELIRAADPHVDNDPFYGDAVQKFEAMANSTGGCGEAHFRMWCRIAAAEIRKARQGFVPVGFQYGFQTHNGIVWRNSVDKWNTADIVKHRTIYAVKEDGKEGVAECNKKIIEVLNQILDDSGYLLNDGSFLPIENKPSGGSIRAETAGMVIDALMDLQEYSPWQPIRTAPKDGS